MAKHLTKRQLELVAWAVEPMADHWCTEQGAHARDGEVLPESAMPYVLGKQVTLSTVPEVNDDLLYRLEEQLPDMVRGNPDAPRGDAKLAVEAAGIIREWMAEFSTGASK